MIYYQADLSLNIWNCQIFYLHLHNKFSTTMLTKKDKKKRYNKKFPKGGAHTFDGFFDKMTKQTREAFSDNLGGAIGGIAGAATGAINTGMEAAKLQGVEEAQAGIDKQASFQSTATTQDDLLAEMAGAGNIKSDYNYKDFMQSGGDFAKSMVSGAMQGVASGASAGPWGAVAGAGAALLGGTIGRLVARSKAKTEAAEKNQAAKEANQAKAQALTAKAGALDQAADARSLAAYYADGGQINPFPSSEFGSPITEFNAGGSHEENPYDGIPQGIAPDGLPNLVEEGEVKFDNYIFSDRLMLSKKDKQKYKFLKVKTYADAAKAIKKDLGIDERPNDLIAKTDLEEQLDLLSTLQEEERAKRGLRGENRMMYKNGGHIFSGDDWDWDADEEALTGSFPTSQTTSIWDIVGVPKVASSQEEQLYKVPRIKKNGNYEIGKNGNIVYDAVNESDPRAVDSIPILSDKSPFPSGVSPVTLKHESQGVIPIAKGLLNPAYTQSVNAAEENPAKSKTFNYNSLLQAAPALGNALGVLAQAFNKPKYEYAEELQNSNDTFTPISYTPITQRLTYKPFDVNYFGNKLGAQAGAARRAIREQTASNPYAATAALLAADANAQAQLGDLYKKAEDHNLAQREKVEAFNRATDSANSEMGMKAQQLNASLLNSKYDRDTKRDLYAAQMKLAEDSAWSAAMSENLSALFDNIGLIGKEALEREDAAARTYAEAKNLTPELEAWYMDRIGKLFQNTSNTKEKTRRGKRKNGFTR